MIWARFERGHRRLRVTHLPPQKGEVEVWKQMHVSSLVGFLGKVRKMVQKGEIPPKFLRVNMSNYIWILLGEKNRKTLDEFTTIENI